MFSARNKGGKVGQLRKMAPLAKTPGSSGYSARRRTAITYSAPSYRFTRTSVLVRAHFYRPQTCRVSSHRAVPRTDDVCRRMREGRSAFRASLSFPTIKNH